VAKSQASGEWEYHIVGVRHNVVGSGNLQLSVESLRGVNSLNLLDLPMTNPNDYEPIRLANFQSQRIRLIGQVDASGEWFEIRRIVMYIKQVAIERPILS